MKYIFNGDMETKIKLLEVFLKMAQNANIEINLTKGREFLNALIEALEADDIFMRVRTDRKDGAGRSVVHHVLKADRETLAKLRKVFMRVAKAHTIKIGVFTGALFLKRLVAALIREGVFVEVEEDDENEATGQ